MSILLIAFFGCAAKADFGPLVAFFFIVLNYSFASQSAQLSYLLVRSE